MAKIVKPDMTYVWASGGSKTAPSNVKIQTGWIVEKPEFQKMNWVQNRQDDALAYIFQMGIPEWDSAVEYQYSATYTSYVQKNGLVYKALQVGTNKNPTTQPTYWELVFDNYGSADTVQSNLTTHITNYGTLASLSNAVTARTNLGVYSKGEGDARYAALAGISTQLFLVANGTTGHEAVNKSQLDTKAAVAGNSGQEFAVATATTGDSAVNKAQFDAKTGNASTTAAGIVEKATQAEMNAGTADKFPSAAEIFNGFSFSSGNKEFTVPTFMGGLAVKMGTVTTGNLSSGNNPQTVSFTNPFPTNCLMAFAVPKTSGASDIPNFWVSVNSYAANNMVVWLYEVGTSDQGVGAGFNWLAIGY